MRSRPSLVASTCFPARAESCEVLQHVHAMLTACAKPAPPSVVCIAPAVVPLGQAQVNVVSAQRPKLKDMHVEQRATTRPPMWQYPPCRPFYTHHHNHERTATSAMVFSDHPVVFSY